MRQPQPAALPMVSLKGLSGMWMRGQDNKKRRERGAEGSKVVLLKGLFAYHCRTSSLRSLPGREGFTSTTPSESFVTVRDITGPPNETVLVQIKHRQAFHW